MIRQILIVDDDRDFAEACCNFLEAAGYNVACETEEKKALEKIRSHPPDLILLDVMMEQKDSGFRLAETLHGDQALKDIPVIFLTGYFKKTEPGEKEQLAKKWSNIYAILDKPVRPAILLDVIKKAEQSVKKREPPV